MATRFYLKEKPTDVEGTVPLKLTQDVYGYYFEMDCPLEIMELPPAIKPENIRRISIVQPIAELYVNRNGYERVVYRYCSCVAVYDRHHSNHRLTIVGDDLEAMREFWRMFKMGRAASCITDVEASTPNKNGNRLSRALRILVGQE
jgi:hypothetical protein